MVKKKLFFSSNVTLSLALNSLRTRRTNKQLDTVYLQMYYIVYISINICGKSVDDNLLSTLCISFESKEEIFHIVFAIATRKMRQQLGKRREPHTQSVINYETSQTQMKRTLCLQRRTNEKKMTTNVLI